MIEVLLAAKNQSADNHALIDGLIGGLVTGGFIALVMAMMGAIDPEHTRKAAVIGVIMLVVSGLVYRGTHT